MTQPHDNNNPVHPQTLSQNALNVVLVVIETLLTLLLRFDAQLRQRVYPLAQSNTVVCFHSYVPQATIYATFTVNGILLDSQLQPNQQVDVTINGFTWEIAQAIFVNKPAIVEKLQIRGERDKAEQVKDFLLAIGIANVVQNIVASLFSKNDKKTDNQDDTDKKLSVTEYRTRINEQQNTINQLTIEQTEFNAQIKQLHSQNKFLKTCVAVLSVVLMIVIIVWLIWGR